jgi:hypothetical protein
LDEADLMAQYIAYDSEQEAALAAVDQYNVFLVVPVTGLGTKYLVEPRAVAHVDPDPPGVFRADLPAGGILYLKVGPRWLRVSKG